MNRLKGAVGPPNLIIKIMHVIEAKREDFTPRES